MAEPKKLRSWWTTIPGMLTALGTFIGAVAALIVALNQIGIFTFKSPVEQKSSTSSVETTADTYGFGIYGNHEIDRIIIEARKGFKSVLTKDYTSLKDMLVFGTTLTFSKCVTTPFVVKHEDGATWSCGVGGVSRNASDIILELDAVAKIIANALPSTWKLRERPGPGTRQTRLLARDPAGRVSVAVSLSERKGTFSGDLEFYFRDVGT